MAVMEENRAHWKSLRDTAMTLEGMLEGSPRAGCDHGSPPKDEFHSILYNTSVLIGGWGSGPRFLAIVRSSLDQTRRSWVFYGAGA